LVEETEAKMTATQPLRDEHKDGGLTPRAASQMFEAREATAEKAKRRHRAGAASMRA
jgi:hypothetical protein